LGWLCLRDVTDPLGWITNALVHSILLGLPITPATCLPSTLALLCGELSSLWAHCHSLGWTIVVGSKIILSSVVWSTA
tara:strand:- start:346 stop:579 length:234 start_codon:yes stop_codon:yes gene_type:complete